MMAKASAHKWEFRPRFRRRAFGWKSQPAIKHVKEAISEIKKVARSDKVLAAEGAVLFLEKVSPALEQVDSSSGAIGSAVNTAIATFAPIIASAPADPKTRDRWLERLWDAYQADGMPYIEMLGDYWGELCASKEVASRWADELLGTCKMAWSPNPDLRGFFKGTTNCLSALLAAERYQELLALLEMAPYQMWHYHQYGVKALVAMGKRAEAIRYAEERRGLNDSPIAIARACEEILLSSGLVEEAYEKYGLVANQSGTYASWFRAVAKKYPHKKPGEILEDLIAETPGEEGKWFAAAKNAKLFDEAIALANRTPCSPQTLTRAARDFEEKNPSFAVEAGMAALFLGTRVCARRFHARKQGLAGRNSRKVPAISGSSTGIRQLTFARHHGESAGHVYVLLVMGVAAAEFAVGLAIIIQVFRQRRTVDVDALRDMHG